MNYENTKQAQNVQQVVAVPPSTNSVAIDTSRDSSANVSTPYIGRSIVAHDLNSRTHVQSPNS